MLGFYNACGAGERQLMTKAGIQPLQSVAVRSDIALSATLREITPLYILEGVFGFYNACGAGARQRKALSFPQAPYLCTGAAQRWGARVIRFLARGWLRQWVVQAHF